MKCLFASGVLPTFHVRLLRRQIYEWNSLTKFVLTTGKFKINRRSSWRILTLLILAPLNFIRKVHAFSNNNKTFYYQKGLKLYLPKTITKIDTRSTLGNILQNFIARPIYHYFCYDCFSIANTAGWQPNSVITVNK